MVRVTLPYQLRNLARVDGDVTLDVEAPVTVRSVLDALEDAFPMLRGTIRQHGSVKRRPRVRFYAARQDVSDAPPDTPLPESVATGKEPFLVIGAISGG